MQALVVYESMFGNTRRIADAVAAGLAQHCDVTVREVNAMPEDFADEFELIVAGGPTHAHSLSRPSSRAEADTWAKDPARQLILEPNARGIGIREWLQTLRPSRQTFCAAFATRADIAHILSGDASTGILKRLVKRGLTPAQTPHSFLVSSDNRLEDDQLELARAWGAGVGRSARSMRNASVGSAVGSA
ncbi:MAG: flavodoxin domain-containing protein [Leifsonia sp.]